jgi:hypothetical protein
VFWIDDVVLPVGLENPSVIVEVALVGGEAVGALENGEKIREQVDQHSTGRGRAARESCDRVARWTRNDSNALVREQESRRPSRHGTVFPFLPGGKDVDGRRERHR